MQEEFDQHAARPNDSENAAADDTSGPKRPWDVKIERKIGKTSPKSFSSRLMSLFLDRTDKPT